jgi:phosphate transport system substrate-binding protein
MRRSGRLLRGAAAVVLATVWLLPATPAGASEPINGGGSTWSAVAISQWQSDVARQGLTVNYQSVGSTSGRVGFYNSQFDFAASEIPFQSKYCPNPTDPTSCSNEISLVHRSYLYMPDVAGGTSILYNLQVNGQHFTRLNLSPRTLTEIFTGKVTNWNSADIAADNPGTTFPNLAITPVVRSDGSGTSYQLTAFMAAIAPDLWGPFSGAPGGPPTSQFPAPNGFAAQNGSDGVANFVAAPYNNGSIGYAEAAYGLQRGVPLVSMKNAAGAYVQPTAKAVAVALTKAIINADHTQNLSGVYTNTDPRTYPISSYSYLIVPTGDSHGVPQAPMDVSKGTTLSRFILYFLCQGQQEAAPLGYSPLPPNLVQLGFSVEQQIPGAMPPPALSACNNPTITGNFLADIGTPSVAGVGGPTGAGKTGSVATGNAAGHTSATPGASSAGGTSGGSTAATAPGTGGGGAGAPSGGGPVDNPAYPLQVSAISGVPQSFGKSWRPASPAAAVLIVLVLVGCALGPPGAGVLRRRGAGQSPPAGAPPSPPETR